MRRAAVAALGLFAATGLSAPRALAWSYVPPPGLVFGGLTGGTTIARYEHFMGKHPPVFETFMTWNTSTAWLAGRDSSFRARLALHISTARGYGQPGVISPRGIAVGGSDQFLGSLNRNLAHSGRVVYIRLMGEMNGYWNPYAAFGPGGGSRGAAYAPSAFIAAWRRSVLILRGGPVAHINLRLAELGLPPVRGLRSTAVLPRPRVTFLWVPQDAGSPDIPANAPGAYWPGASYVDWVGTDFYGSYPNFTLLDSFYARYPGKPFVLSEWALYGQDDPSFVSALFAWARSHPRVRMLNYYQGFTAASLPDLGHYSRSRAVLRRELSSTRFIEYAPEYARPAPSARPRIERPPLPPGLALAHASGAAPLPPLPTPPPCVPMLGLCVAVPLPA